MYKSEIFALKSDGIAQSHGYLCRQLSYDNKTNKAYL